MNLYTIINIAARRAFPTISIQAGLQMLVRSICTIALVAVIKWNHRYKRKASSSDALIARRRLARVVSNRHWNRVALGAAIDGGRSSRN